MKPEPWFQSPFRIEAEGKPIEVDIGHAAPFVVDVDGDGVKDLLVGQYGPGGKAPEGQGGRGRVYRNLGSNAVRKFADFTWLMAGDDAASMLPMSMESS